MTYDNDCQLYFNPSRKQPVAHDELNLIVAREGRRQNNLRLRREYGSGIDYVAVLILNNKGIVGMIGLKREGVVIDVNQRHLNRGSASSMTNGLVIFFNTHSKWYQFLNSINGGLDANNNYLDKSYGSYTTHIQTDAKPVYWQATNVSAFPGVTNSNKKPFSRHFILRVRWPAGELDNTDKETDIIYITASRSTG